MRIVLLCEGITEKALRASLKPFMDRITQSAGVDRVGLDVMPFKGFPDCDQIQDRLELHAVNEDVLAVIGLLDVYPNFSSAGALRAFMIDCIGKSAFANRFHAHAAQYEFEAWLLPFWDDICRRLGTKAKRPGANPEEVNNQKPPSKHLDDLYRRATKKGYVKTIEAPKILKGNRIEDAAEECAELRALLDTLKRLCRSLVKNE